MPPLIGLTGRRLEAAAVEGFPAAFRGLRLDAYFVPYAAAVAAVGGVPVLLTREADPAHLLDRLDGLLLVGGADVDPATYGGTSGSHDTPHDPGLDRFELALADGAVARDIPVLGVCRGCQVLNVAFGGTLVSHLPPDSGDGHSDLDHDVAERRHRVQFEPGSLLADLYGAEVCTNSFHHQAVDRPGEGVRVVGRSDDGVTEAIEVPGRRVVGVQWHPELHPEGEHVFRWLVGEAAR